MDDDAFDDFRARDYATIVAAIAAVVGDVSEARDAVDEATARAWEQARRDRMPDSLAA
ncbi:MAG TPA: hypothetical protein VFW74_01780 [Acidimicrobiia bacterium]|nr:hypothetical protein [Acidimicrobiia bacterium]